MTSEEIRETIERLGDTTAYSRVLHGLMSGTMNVDYGPEDMRDLLIELLRQADPDTHIKLPMDADGRTVHIGDMMECDRLPNGCRVCGEVKSIGDGVVWLNNVQYAIHAEYLHHHVKMLGEVLRECCDAYHAAVLDEEGDTVMADVLTPTQVLLKYTDEIREAVANESR